MADAVVKVIDGRALVQFSGVEAISAMLADAAAAAAILGEADPFSLGLLSSASAAAFRLAVGAQSRVVIDVTDAPYFAVFDGTSDVTAALQAAINTAASAGGATVVLPGGVGRLTATIQVPSSVSIEGKGRTATRLFKTTIYGPMFQFGTSSAAWQGGSIEGFWAYHDYGIGPFPPTIPAQVASASGTEAILDFYGPYNARIEDIWASGGGKQLRLRGGSTSLFQNCSFTGVYDPTQAALQCSPDGMLMEIGANGEIPTNLRFNACNFTGNISPGPRSITWPDPGGTGPHVTTDVVQNIGPQRTVHITCCESIAFSACYFGASAKHNISFDNIGNIISGVSIDGSFMDAAHEEQVAFEGSGTTTSIELTMREWVGQNNGFGALTDKNYTGGGYSVAGCEVTGEMRAFIGTPIRMSSWRGYTVNSPIRWWNTKGFYTGLAGYNCAIWTGPTSKVGQINGRLGGDNACEPDAKTVVGVLIAPGAVGIDAKNASDGGLAGALVTGGFDSFAIRGDTSSFSLRQRVDACKIVHLGSGPASDITITPDTTGANDGDEWEITRASNGAGNILFAVTGANHTLPASLNDAKPAWVRARYFLQEGQVRVVAWGDTST